MVWAISWGLIMNAKQLTTHPPPFFRAVLLPPPPLDPSTFSFYRYDIESLDDRSQEKAAGLEDSRAIIDGTVRARPGSNSLTLPLTLPLTLTLNLALTLTLTLIIDGTVRVCP